MKNCYLLKGVLFQLNMEMERTWNSVDIHSHIRKTRFLFIMVQVSLSLLILCDTNLSWSSTYLLLFVLATYISSGGISLPSANRAALCSLSASRLALSVSKSQQSGPWQMTHPDKLQSYSLHPFYICLLSVTLIFSFFY